MEILDNAVLFGNGFSLALTAWFLGLGFSKALNMYKSLTT